MRDWIDIVEAEDFDHPHLHGQDEIFSMFWGRYNLNVDLCRRLIASGQVKKIDYAMPVKKGGQMLLGLTEEEFGQREEPEDITFFNIGGTHFDRKRFSVIPQIKREEPAIMVMWNALRADPKMNKGLEDKGAPYLIDGNHRLAMRYFEGDEGTMLTWVVQDWNDIAKFTFMNGKCLAKSKK